MTKLLKHLAQLDAAVSASRLGPTGRHCVHLSHWERLSHSEERRGVRTMHKFLQAGPRWLQLETLQHYLYSTAHASDAQTTLIETERFSITEKPCARQTKLDDFMECDIFHSVLWQRWLGDRKGIRPSGRFVKQEQWERSPPLPSPPRLSRHLRNYMLPVTSDHKLRASK